jgi:hypothetical protein
MTDTDVPAALRMSQRIACSRPANLNGALEIMLLPLIPASGDGHSNRITDSPIGNRSDFCIRGFDRAHPQWGIWPDITIVELSNKCEKRQHFAPILIP